MLKVNRFLSARGLALAVFVVATVMAAPMPVQGADDVTDPVLVEFDVAPVSVDTSAAAATVTITARVTDNLSGVDQVCAWLNGPSGQHPGVCFGGQRISGDDLDGVYQGTITLPQYSQLGTWPIDVLVRDRADNDARYYHADLAGHGFPNQVVISDNEAPTADAGGPYLVAVGARITFDGQLSSDPDSDPLTYAWSADAGSFQDPGVVMPTYVAPGVSGIYGVSLTVHDGSDSSDPAVTTVVVYDPAGGFVTGGGWFYSDPGAYVADPSAHGKATFGFVSKYKKGAATPTGNTAFEFQAGEFEFASNGFDWLVVTGSDFAKFKGVGTVNGAGQYKFLIWAGDGPDTFRIKIWTELDGVESVFYDNGFDQTLGGGSIVIHTRK